MVVRWLLSLFALSSAVDGPAVTFDAYDPTHAAAAAEYRQLWCSEGPRIMAAMEQVTGFPYPAGKVEVFVGNVTPMTAFGGKAMSLKASYPLYYKRATLVHELGHRLAFTMPRTADLDEHRLLYLFLYDVWSDLYGRDFADRMVSIEQSIAGRYNYAAAWDWALAIPREDRQARLAGLRQSLLGASRTSMPAEERHLPGCERKQL
jgi:hypothetical protein